jgi:phosphatidylinositol-3-phosphatase
MKRFAPVLALFLFGCSASVQPPAPAVVSEAGLSHLSWPSGLPVYDHIVIVVEENKDYEQIIDSPAAPYINGTLKAEGASLTQMFAEEHHSQGNYFWLLSGSNQNVGFSDQIPKDLISARNLGRRLMDAGRSFKGYSEDLPSIGSTEHSRGLYARKHVPWISFSDLPDGTTAAGSSNLRFQDFPASFSDLPTVSFVIPNLINDMHDGSVPASVTAGDTWLRQHLADYYQWAKQNNSLLILTFDENDKKLIFGGLTNPAASKPKDQNRIVTILAGAHIKPGEYNEWKGVTHVNLLRTLEAMYGLEKSGAQQPFALAAGITDDFIITNVFTTVP